MELEQSTVEGIMELAASKEDAGSKEVVAAFTTNHKQMLTSAIDIKNAAKQIIRFNKLFSKYCWKH